MAVCDQLLHHRHDLRDGLGDAWVGVRALDVQCVHLPQVDRVVTIRELRDADPQLARLPHHVVVDVGDVLDVTHVVRVELQPSAQRVEGNGDQRVAQVAHVVRGDAADVHGHLSVVDGLEGLHAAGQAVVEVQVVVAVWLQQRRAPVVRSQGSVPRAGWWMRC